jgi:hypothetical protein
MMRTVVGPGLVLLLVACGSQNDGKVKVAIPPEHVAAVNALVPAEWKAKVEFELGSVKDTRGGVKGDTYKLALPRGWKPAYKAGSLQPPDADEFGRSVGLGATAQMMVGSNCNGECMNKDWAAEVDKTYYQKFTAATELGTITRDDKTATGRTLVFTRPDEVNILTTWWQANGSQHFICEVKLQDAAMVLAPAFEKACSLVSTE